MIKWGDSRRDSDTILAVWPVYRGPWDRWLMQEFAQRGDDPPQWRDRRAPHGEGHVRMDVYATEAEARAEADRLNAILDAATANRSVNEPIRTSLKLKARKAVQASRRPKPSRCYR